MVEADKRNGAISSIRRIVRGMIVIDSQTTTPKNNSKE
jgi:hypothetical protein